MTDDIKAAASAKNITIALLEGNYFDDSRWATKQDKLVSGENIKTVNGKSLLGSGDINTSYPVIERTATTVTLDPNQYNIWGEVGALVISLGGQVAGNVNEYIIQFTCAASTSLTLPENIAWADGIVPSLTQGKTYVVSIVNNLAVFAQF